MNNKTKLWIGRVLTLLAAAVFLFSAAGKLTQAQQVRDTLTHAGIPESAIVPIGILELTLLALYLIPPTSIFGMLMLTGYLGGAIVVHLILRQSIVLPLLVGVFVDLGAYLRFEELQRLVPLRLK